MSSPRATERQATIAYRAERYMRVLRRDALIFLCGVAGLVVWTVIISEFSLSLQRMFMGSVALSLWVG